MTMYEVSSFAFPKQVIDRTSVHSACFRAQSATFNRGRTTAGFLFQVWHQHVRRRAMAASLSGDFDSVLSNEDLGVGILLAFILAALASFLQSRRVSSDFALDFPPLRPDVKGEVSTNTTSSIFRDWKDVSKPDNYILFNTRQRNKVASTSTKEQRWVLMALVLLFAPIFTFEFLLTVGRQLICIVSSEMCLPYSGGNM